MGVLLYATAGDSDLNSVDLDAPVLTQRIRYASALVRQATRTAYYDTTATGAPRDEDVAEGFRQAVVAQVVAWHILDVDPAAGPAQVTGTKQSQSMLSASFTMAVRAGADQDKADTTTTLVPAARAALWDLTQLPDRPFVWTP